MQDGAIPVLAYLAVILAIVIYAIAKVFRYIRQSDEQWKLVDKSKLKAWDDDDD